MKLYLFTFLCFLSAHSFSMYYGRPLTQEDLDQVARVEERRSPDFLKFVAVLNDGRKINYSENLTGENAGFATFSTTMSPSCPQKNSADEYSTDYWRKVITAKLQQ